MNRIKIQLVALYILTLGINALSHEDHDHGTKTALKAPKGGVIKALEQSLLEVVSKGDNLKIYIYDKELKPRALKEITLTATAQKPKSKTKEEIIFKPNENFFEANYNANGIHRYTLVLTIKDSQAAHNDTLNFTIEPKK